MTQCCGSQLSLMLCIAALRICRVWSHASNATCAASLVPFRIDGAITEHSTGTIIQLSTTVTVANPTKQLCHVNALLSHMLHVPTDFPEVPT